MADIKQAAKWMQEWGRVRSPRHVKGCFLQEVAGQIVDERGDPYQMDTEDLLADDWELFAEDSNG